MFFATSFAGMGAFGLTGFSAALGLVCGRVDGAGAGLGNVFGAGFGSSAAFGCSGCGGGGLGAAAGIELVAFSSSFRSIKLAAMGGGVSIFTSGIDRKKPNPQIISSQTSVASGNGHHRRMSLDRELAMPVCVICV